MKETFVCVFLHSFIVVCSFDDRLQKTVHKNHLSFNPFTNVIHEVHGRPLLVYQEGVT